MKPEPTKLNRVGIDVSAKTLDVAIETDGKKIPLMCVNNDHTGHKKLLKKLTKRGYHARVVLEATGSYSFKLAMALEEHPRVEVMVGNPRALKRFAEACMQRGKSDPLDAGSILEFCKRMDFQKWVRPSDACLELRCITRRIRQLTDDVVADKNRLGAKHYEGPTAKMVINDIEVNIRHLEKRIDLLEKTALTLIKPHEDLQSKYDLLITVNGIGQTSALHLLGELMIISKDMTAPQWVALAGLDPRLCQSGTSLNKKKRISKAGNKYIRAALYMPAMTAARRDPHIRSFYLKLVDDRKKKEIVALVAVMRKLLHAIWGMFKYKQPFQGASFHPLRVEKEQACAVHIKQ